MTLAAARRIALLLAAPMVVAASLTACTAGGQPMMTATADFTDVGSLAHHAAVEMAGINIGYVSRISVDGDKARLTLRFPRSARVPASVIAQVRRASVLGPQLIELVVPNGAANDLPLADHATIVTTVVRPDLEDLIKSGADLIGVLSTSDLAKLVEQGAQSFGGEGPVLHQTIDSLNTVLAGYASRTKTISSLVQDLDSFASALGPSAQANAQAISNLARAAAVLDEQRVRLTTLLGSLDTVSQQGVALLSTQLPQIADQLLALRTTTEAIANQQQALGKLLANLDGHNLATSQPTVNSFIQVLNDFVICGLPNHAGGDVPGSALDSCFTGGHQ